MEIRQAKLADVPTIMKIYEKARVFMENSGNPTQWAVGYPGQQLVEKDIIEKNCYICEEQGKVVGVFSVYSGRGPDISENRAWCMAQRRNIWNNTQTCIRWTGKGDCKNLF